MRTVSSVVVFAVSPSKRSSVRSFLALPRTPAQKRRKSRSAWFQVCLVTVALCAGIVPSAASAGVVIENDFTGTGSLKITLNGFGETHIVSCSSSTTTGVDTNPISSQATIEGWTAGGCSAYGGFNGTKYLGPASVTIPTPVQVQAVGLTTVYVGALEAEVTYQVNSSTCRPKVWVGGSYYTYSNGSSTNTLSGFPLQSFFDWTEPLPSGCFSSGSGNFEPSFSFKNPQFEVVEASSPPPPAKRQVSAVVTSGGKLYARDTGISGEWVDITPAGVSAVSTSAAFDPVDGPAFGVIASNGHAYVKEGLNGTWVDEYAGAKSVSVGCNSSSGAVIAVVGTNGTAYAKQGLSGAWNEEYAGAKQVSVACDSSSSAVLGVVGTNEKAYAKKGLTGAWVEEYAGAKEISVGSDVRRGPLIGVLGTNEKAYVKQGLTGVWNEEYAGAKQISVSSDSVHGALIGVISTNEKTYAKQGITGVWVEEFSGVTKSLNVVTSGANGPLIGIVASDAHAYLKEGLFGAWGDQRGGVVAYAIAD